MMMAPIPAALTLARSPLISHEMLDGPPTSPSSPAGPP
jgi:hypothetical protein